MVLFLPLLAASLCACKISYRQKVLKSLALRDLYNTAQSYFFTLGARAVGSRLPVSLVLLRSLLLGRWA